jgi:hypothetical protein
MLFLLLQVIAINEAIYLSELHINKSQVGSEKNNSTLQNQHPAI